MTGMYFWNEQMVREALSENYRHMFREHFGRDAEVQELYDFYRLKNPQRN